MTCPPESTHTYKPEDVEPHVNSPRLAHNSYGLTEKVHQRGGHKFYVLFESFCSDCWFRNWIRVCDLKIVWIRLCTPIVFNPLSVKWIALLLRCFHIGFNFGSKMYQLKVWCFQLGLKLWAYVGFGIQFFCWQVDLKQRHHISHFQYGLKLWSFVFDWSRCVHQFSPENRCLSDSLH